MPSCRLCGSPVFYKEHKGRLIALDQHEVSRGPDRYAIVDDELRPVAADADVLAYTDHRSTCVYSARTGGVGGRRW